MPIMFGIFCLSVFLIIAKPPFTCIIIINNVIWARVISWYNHDWFHYDTKAITSIIQQTSSKLGTKNEIMRQKVIIAKNR